MYGILSKMPFSMEVAMFKDRTKKLFAAELETMLAEIPLSKVRVNELCARCGAQRQVFYYHFKDKYDLVAWIFEQDFRAGVEDAVGGGYQEQTARALAHMWARRNFYRIAFADKSQNSIERHIQEFDVAMSTGVVLRHSGAKKLSDQWIFDIKSHSYGSIGCTIEWLRGELDATPEKLAAWECVSMPAFLLEAYDDAARGGWSISTALSR